MQVDATQVSIPDGRNRLLYPLMVIAAIAVILLSLVGIASMTGLIPRADAERQGAAVTRDKPPATSGKEERGMPAGQRQSPAAVPQRRAARPVARCDACGTVESVRAVQAAGQGSGVGAVAGGVVGGVLGNQVGGGSGRAVATVLGAAGGAYAGHEIERGMKRSLYWEVQVRMDDGTLRTLSLPEQPAVGVGQKVRMENGALVGIG